MKTYIKFQLIILAIATLFACSSDIDLVDEVIRDTDSEEVGTDDTSDSTDENTGTVPPEDEQSATVDSDLGPEVLNSITTSELGWLANEDVTDKLAAFVATAKAGDELCLSHMYKLRDAGISFPDSFTLCAVKDAGFSLLDVQNSNRAYLEIGNNNLWNNVTIKDEEPLAAEATVIANNKTAVLIDSGRNISIVNSSFDTNAKIHLDIRGVTNLVLKGTRFSHGFYQIFLRASSSEILIEDCLFANSYGDGIKTTRAGVNGVENVTVKNTVFEDNLRDGLDTTGGFRNSLVDGCILRRNGVSGMDLKNIYEHPNDVGQGSRGNDFILIKNSEFIDQNSAVVFTSEDRTETNMITDENHAYHLPNNIKVENSIIENNTGARKRGFLIKDAHTISWDGLQLLGDLDLDRTFGPRDYPNQNHHRDRPIISRTNYDIEGINLTTGSARGANNNYPFEAIGPR